MTQVLVWGHTYHDHFAAYVRRWAENKGYVFVEASTIPPSEHEKWLLSANAEDPRVLIEVHQTRDGYDNGLMWSEGECKPTVLLKMGLPTLKKELFDSCTQSCVVGDVIWFLEAQLPLTPDPIATSAALNKRAA